MQKSLQTLEASSKQQLELSNRTVRELRERLDRLSLEEQQKDRQVQDLRKEVDQYAREKQTKVSNSSKERLAECSVQETCLLLSLISCRNSRVYQL